MSDQIKVPYLRGQGGRYVRGSGQRRETVVKYIQQVYFRVIKKEQNYETLLRKRRFKHKERHQCLCVEGLWGKKVSSSHGFIKCGFNSEEVLLSMAFEEGRLTF